MEILLAVAVAIVAVASYAIAARFKGSIEATETRIDQAAEQAERNAVAFGRGLEAQSASDRHAWSTALDAVRQDVASSLAEVRRQVQQAQARVGEHGRDTGLFRADLEHETSQRLEGTRELREVLQSEASQRHDMIRQLTQEVRGDVAAIRTAGERTSGRHARDLESLRAAARSAEERAAAAERALAAVQRQFAETRQQLDRVRRHVEQEDTKNALDFSYLSRHLIDVRHYLKRQLDDEVAGLCEPDRSALIGGVQAGQAAAAQIIPVFYEDFCRALSIEILFREAWRGGMRCYLRWNPLNGGSPRQLFEQLLSACPDSASESLPGLDELRGLLLAVHSAEPATIQVGSMVASRSHGSLLCGFLTPRNATTLQVLQAAVLSGDHEVLAQAMEPGTVMELSAWASDYGLS